MAAVTAVAAAEAGRKISALMAVLLVSKAVFLCKYSSKVPVRCDAKRFPLRVILSGER